jgi:hypothetical protein
VTFGSGTLTVSATVTVEPSGAGGGGPPPATPPSISLSYPTEDNKSNVVSEGTKLTLIGNIRSGSLPVTKLQVLDYDGSLLQEWTVVEGGFRVDLERFGSPGSKQVKIRVLDTNGNFSETSLQLINDPSLLEQLARDFLRRYCSTPGDGKIVRYGDLQDGPFAQPVLVYLWDSVKPYRHLVEEAFRFWESYTGIRFQFLETLPGPEDPRPRCAITADFNADPGYAATTIRGYINSYKVIGGSITLYRGWWSASEGHKVKVLAHELGHILLIQHDSPPDWHTNDGSLMDADAPQMVLHCYQQLAVRLLYSRNPGDPLP